MPVLWEKKGEVNLKCQQSWQFFKIEVQYSEGESKGAGTGLPGPGRAGWIPQRVTRPDPARPPFLPSFSFCFFFFKVALNFRNPSRLLPFFAGSSARFAARLPPFPRRLVLSSYWPRFEGGGVPVEGCIFGRKSVQETLRENGALVGEAWCKLAEEAEHETGDHGVALAIVERDNEWVRLCVRLFAAGGECACQRRWCQVCVCVVICVCDRELCERRGVLRRDDVCQFFGSECAPCVSVLVALAVHRLVFR